MRNRIGSFWQAIIVQFHSPVVVVVIAVSQLLVGSPGELRRHRGPQLAGAGRDMGSTIVEEGEFVGNALSRTSARPPRSTWL